MFADRTSTSAERPRFWEHLLAQPCKRTLLQEVYCHAAEAYPDECCGFIRASGEVHRAVNDQDRLHVEDPVNWPCCAREAYSMAAADVFLFAQSFESPDPAIVVYHSHPDVGAYFSERDAAEALIGGKPIYNVDHLIVDVCNARPRGAKLFRFLGSGFRCVWSESL